MIFSNIRANLKTLFEINELAIQKTLEISGL